MKKDTINDYMNRSARRINVEFFHMFLIRNIISNSDIESILNESNKMTELEACKKLERLARFRALKYIIEEAPESAKQITIKNTFSDNEPKFEPTKKMKEELRKAEKENKFKALKYLVIEEFTFPITFADVDLEYIANNWIPNHPEIRYL